MNLSLDFWTRVWFGPHAPGWRNFFDTAARRYAVWWPLVLIFSMTASSFMTICVSICWLLSGHFAEKWRIVRNNPVALASLGMGLLTVAGCLYSTGTQADMVKSLLKESNFFLIAMCVTLFDKAFYRDAALALFHLGVPVMIGIRLVMILRYGNEYASMQMVDYVTFGIIVVTWMLLVLYRPFAWWQLWPGMETAASGKDTAANCDPAATEFPLFRFKGNAARLVRPILVLLLILFLLGVNPGRTNYLCLMAVLGIILVQKIEWKTVALGSVAVLALLALSVVCFPLFRDRWTLAYKETAAFRADNSIVFTVENSSVGKRLFMYKYGLKAAAENPVFGAGTGGVAAEYDKQLVRFDHVKNSKWRVRIDNPHCEYLNMLIQYGAVGLIGYCGWLGILWRRSFRIAWPWGLLGRCTTAMIAISTLFCTHISNSRTGCFYALMVALFFAAENRAAEKEPPGT